MSHTTGTVTFAQKRHEYVKKHGHEPDRVECFKITHTRGKGNNGQPIDEASKEMMMEFDRRDNEVRERGEPITYEVRNEIFAVAMGPEKRNAVRGYGIGVRWKDVPGVLTERRGISKQVHALKEAYEEQKKATLEAQQEMERIKEEPAQQKRDQEMNMEKLREEQAENLRRAKLQMAEQLKGILASVGIPVDMNAVTPSISMTQQQCGSYEAQTTTRMCGGNIGSQTPVNGPAASTTDFHSANSGYAGPEFAN